VSLLAEYVISLAYRIDPQSFERVNQYIRQVKKAAQDSGDGADAAARELNRSLQHQTRATQQWASSTVPAISGAITRHVNMITTSVIGLAASYMGGRAFSRMSTDLTELNNASLRTGASVQGYRALELAFIKIGGTAADAHGSIEGLSKAFRDPVGAAWAKSMGVTATDMAAAVPQLERFFRSVPEFVAVQFGEKVGLNADWVHLIRSGKLASEYRSADQFVRSFGINQDRAAQNAQHMTSEWAKFGTAAEILRDAFFGGTFGSGGGLLGGINNWLQGGAGKQLGVTFTNLGNEVGKFITTEGLRFGNWINDNLRVAPEKRDWAGFVDIFRNIGTGWGQIKTDVTEYMRIGSEINAWLQTNLGLVQGTKREWDAIVSAVKWYGEHAQKNNEFYEGEGGKKLVGPNALDSIIEWFKGKGKGTEADPSSTGRAWVDPPDKKLKDAAEDLKDAAKDLKGGTGGFWNRVLELIGAGGGGGAGGFGAGIGGGLAGAGGGGGMMARARRALGGGGGDMDAPPGGGLSNAGTRGHNPGRLRDKQAELQQGMEYLTKTRGWTREGAASFLAQAWHESAQTLSPTIEGDKNLGAPGSLGRAYGAFQHRLDRQAKLRDYYAKHGVSWMSNLAFASQEAERRDPSWKNIGSTYEGNLAGKRFEGYAGGLQSQRQMTANTILGMTSGASRTPVLAGAAPILGMVGRSPRTPLPAGTATPAFDRVHGEARPLAPSPSSVANDNSRSLEISPTFNTNITAGDVPAAQSRFHRTHEALMGDLMIKGRGEWR
jgi:hypothetical protein